MRVGIAIQPSAFSISDVPTDVDTLPPLLDKPHLVLGRKSQVSASPRGIVHAELRGSQIGIWRIRESVKR
jgi:hypothetical protein